jgi:hypothetical protein
MRMPIRRVGAENLRSLAERAGGRARLRGSALVGAGWAARAACLGSATL